MSIRLGIPQGTIEILIKKEDGTIETAPFDTTEQTPETEQNEKQELF